MTILSNKTRERLQLEMRYQILVDRKNILSSLRDDKHSELLRERNHQIFQKEKQLTSKEKKSLFESFCQNETKKGHPVLVRAQSETPWESLDSFTRILWESFVRSSLEKELFQTPLAEELAAFLKREDVDRKLKQTMTEMSHLLKRLEKLNNPTGQLSLFQDL